MSRGRLLEKLKTINGNQKPTRTTVTGREEEKRRLERRREGFLSV